MSILNHNGVFKIRYYENEGNSYNFIKNKTGLELDAVAAFRSGLALPVIPNEKLKAKILVQNGADDVMISEDQINTLKSQLETANSDYEYIAYECFKHSYTNKAAYSISKVYDLLQHNMKMQRKD